MDQKRLFTAILISIAILLGYQLVARRFLPQPPVPTVHTEQPAVNKTATPAEGGPSAGVPAVATPAPAPVNAPRLKIAAPAIRGSINLLGARIDDVVLNDYRQTVAPGSPDVQLLEPATSKTPYFVQYGWSAAPGETARVPGDDTVWAASAPVLDVGH
ncbi:MAG: membrane protein insertase YidC, partial [Acetobacteraceae bacterium]